MIISRIDGGLGNQMFQYAYGLYLAEQHRTDLKLDLSSYAGGPEHGYLLDRFQISAPTLKAEEARYVPPRYRPAPEFQQESSQAPASKASKSWLQKLKVLDFLGPHLPRHKESTFGFAAKHLRVSNHRYLVGYWQSEKFFPGLRSRLLDEFQPASPLSPASQAVSRRMENCHSIALHVRRGDYLSNKQAAQIYESLSQTYYQRCVEEQLEKHPESEVFLFSNDIAWCKENFAFDVPMHCVDHNDATTAHEDMFLMSKAAACVIANSTFSWWAAWLNTRPEKTIYAPSRWFRPGGLDGQHILCDSWLQRDDSAAAQQAA